MTRPVRNLVLVLAVAAVAGVYFGSDREPALAIPEHAEVRGIEAGRARLEAVRRRGDPTALARFVAAQRDRVERLAGAPPAERIPELRLLALARLEQVLLAGASKGMRVGEPIHDELPGRVTRWIDAGIERLQQARELGDDTSESHRIESALLSNRITGMASALRYQGRVLEALSRAGALDPDNPHVHVAKGCRLLLLPRLLGHDPERALEHLRFACRALPRDERPRVFAAMAEWECGRRGEALRWLREAVRLNPDNRYAAVVLGRIENGEDDPFGRDLLEGTEDTERRR